MRRKAPALAGMLALVLGLASPAQAGPREDADYTEAYFPANDGLGTMLHADVLRPKGFTDDQKTPVILSVSPYFNHTGSTTGFDPNAEGPNERFYDFLNLSGALKQGYTFVMADLPGFGGSGGCNDWGGLREQGAVKVAVEWAAAQPWSTGKVALIGKSYDAWTGLMGLAQEPKGLAAVASLEPVYSGYRYLYMNGVRFLNSVATPALFQAIDAKPGSLNDTPQYHANGAPQAWCYGLNLGLQQQDEETSTFWAERNLIPQVRGETTPLFLTQGFLEANTKPDAAFELWNNLAGTEHRAWFGQFDHCRAWETASACGGAGGGGGNRLAVGREGFIDELMRFFDEHLKGVEPAVEDPTVEVQDNRGLYRSESQWPPVDMRVRWSDLETGAYADGPSPLGGSPVWSFSEVLPHDVWLSGEPKINVRVSTTAPRANLVADVFDVDESGRALLISRGAYLLRAVGEQTASFDLYGQDWRIPAGHRIGVVISAQDRAGWSWTHVPTASTVTVVSSRVGLPFLGCERNPEEYLEGGSTPRLEQHLGRTTDVGGEIEGNERAFGLPGPLAQRPDAEGNGDPDCAL